MSTAELKLYLAKKIIDTDDLELIAYIKSIFDHQQDSWFDELPDEIQKSLNISLEQVAKGEGKTHEEVMNKHRKWRK